MNKKPPKLPETIYGFWYDGDGIESRFLRTGSDPEQLADENKTNRVGVYKLVGLADIENKTTATNITTMKKVT